MDRRLPKVLYHSSPNLNIEVFEPRKEKVRDPKEGPVVFATPDKALAAVFLVRTDGSWVKIGRFSSNGQHTPWHLIANNKRRFRKLDVGGAIYHLPPEGFSSDPTKGMGGVEWTNPKTVVPIKKEIYSSGEKAMQELGVNIYFVSRKVFRAIKKSDDHGHNIISSLTPES